MDTNSILKRITQTTEKVCPTPQCDAGVRVLVSTKEADFFDFNKIISKESFGDETTHHESVTSDFSKVLYQTLEDLKEVRGTKKESLDDTMAELKSMASGILSNIEKLKKEIVTEKDSSKEKNPNSLYKLARQILENNFDFHIEKEIHESTLEGEGEHDLINFPRTKTSNKELLESQKEEKSEL